MNPSFTLMTLLNQLDDFIIEEARDIKDVISIENLQKVNTGNNCLHFDLIKNKNRIVIQTYKYDNMNHTTLDIVQGNVNNEKLFQKINDFINENYWWLTDRMLNIYFITYFNYKRRQG